MKSKKNTFKGLRVVELASVLAGPSVGLFFAELGAEVLKIENKNTNGDITRSWKLPSENKNENASAYFMSVNFLKKHLFLDINTPADYKTCIAHIKKAHIVIANYKKGDDKKLKVDYNTLKKINPKLIYACIQGFSDNEERVAYDLILQAESGFMSMNGTQKTEPLKMPVAMIDLLTAHQLKEAILLALWQQKKTKKGCKISVSLFDTAVASLANQATNWLIAKHVAQRTGSLHPNIAPYGEIFTTQDKHQVTFAIGSNMQFAKLCELLGVEKTATQEKFSTNQLRVINRNKLAVILKQEVKKYPLSYLQKKCIQKKVPFAKIRNIQEVFDLPEAKKLVQTVSFNKKKYQVVSSFTARFS
ncbi:MAG: CoA transferase [Bacteroidetes bacterium]|nr:CoA transferase [Bacteroidota bacterium]